jgi:N-acetylneuraminic acid mutarotase
MHQSLSVLALAAFGLVLPVAGALARDLTLEDRVRAQEAIERVRYSHQDGATKPFEAAVPRALLEKKVTTYLAQSAALEDLWGTPLTADMLAREMERQARRTRMPERLAELHAALGDDAFLVAECLARPVLVDRLSRRFFAADPRFRGKTWDAAWPEVARSLAVDARAIAGTDAIPLPALAVRSSLACPPADTWNNGNLDDVPDARYLHTAVWTGAEMIVWGGIGGASLSTGGRYDPVTDTWTATATVGAPQPRNSHTAVWAGDRMIVWGGFSELLSLNLSTGASYDPATNTWTPISTVAAPTARRDHGAVWTGTEMILWGGQDDSWQHLGTGGRYRPATDTWTPVTTNGAPEPREEMAVAWTGAAMVVWGGINGSTILASGSRYDPASDTWSPMSTVEAPIARRAAAAVWAGSFMFLWGGTAVGGLTNTGSRYDPIADTWAPTSTIGAPPGAEGATAVWVGSKVIVWGGGGVAGRYDPVANTWQTIASPGTTVGVWGDTAVSTGSRMIVWGGVFDGGLVGTGGRYDPVADQWTPTDAGPGAARMQATAVWTGQEMILWGGTNFAFYGNEVNTGDRYDPATDTWSPTTLTGAPSPRTEHTAVWTGSEMIVWGGDVPNQDVGKRYDPIADAWSAVSIVDAPHKRTGHSAVWTGTRMIVWGGADTSQLNTGGLYDPVTDTWTATSTVGAPVKRSNHSAVWTGSRMIVWGGNLRTGGQYDPATDTWTATSTMGAPAGRLDNSAIWTGSRMVVWGGSTSSALQDGGRYDPVADTWAPTSLAGAPSGRSRHSAVWTGKHMIVWGGGPSVFAFFGDGARYDPVTDVWTPTSLASAPPARNDHTAIWTGTVMIVGGGSGALSSGGIYTDDPSLDLDGDGFSVCDGDCDDAASAVYPGAIEACNGIDDDCDLVVDDGVPPPGVLPGLLTGKSGTATVLSWPAVPDATGYDAVKGNLGPLRNSGGNFTTTTKACIADDVAAMTIQDAEVPPPTGGLWFLVRAVNACGGDGTYDEGGPAQQGSRDAEIAASANACP